MSISFRTAFLRHVGQTSPEPDGFEVSHGEGIFLFDKEGNPFIDCISGIAVSSLGHGHPRIKDAIRKQLELHLHTMVYGEHVQEPQVALAEKLAQLLPAELNCTFFTSSGTEAVEGALKAARKYTSRYEIIACRHAYHGSTAGAESLRSDLTHIAGARPLVPGVKHIDFNDFDDLVKITDHTAAIIIEPVQGEAGAIVPSAGYLRAVRDRCHETGTLLILDEIQTGMGRTGSMWAFQQEEVIPDILLLAKAFGGGLPLGAFISSQKIMKVLSHDPILGHLTTFGGHPLSCAAGLEAINILEENHLPARAVSLERIIRKKLEHHRALREVRGRGLMLALELKNPDNLFPAVKACRNEGLLVDWFLFNNFSLRFAPPLIISEEEVNLVCAKLTTALDSL
ncbi:MAG: aspartate aminotransferase family protein [Saprospiraceae bacterium]|nr:aspartate aminotransferase family protein [Candidatus Opimibacter skivensis]MBL0008267.1 aspartate aminotransferase family protein [Candidatus Opimibacter skivensis]MBP6681170.1 aspartate aminotransferase family protein [Saprospiraceae bacterium]MBP8087057.1 aspartate aminotransferase family protein [Saprospiraceae bacterium]